MLFNNILVPYDESEHAKGALHTALAMVGEEPSARVHVIMIVPAGALPAPSLMGDGLESPYLMIDPAGYDHLMESILGRSRADVQQAVKEALDGARCEVVSDAIVAGSPVEGIAEYVERNGIDLVIMGRRGLGALRGMLGSVSFGVLRSVSVPVLTVK